MTERKSSSPAAAAAAERQEQEGKREEETLAAKIRDSADSMKALIHSVSIATEKRIALEDIVNSISREAESMLDQADSISGASQKKLLLAYKGFLEQNLAGVDSRIKNLRQDD